MKLCSSCYGLICDFCIHYAFNGDKIEGFKSLECFNGDGFCRLNGDNHWPEDGCENFVCRNWQAERNELADEFATWDQLSDEAFVDFERSLLNVERQASAQVRV